MVNSAFFGNKLLIDANVLITGIFAPHSKSREVLLAVFHGQLIAYVIENTIDECEKVITRAMRHTSIDLRNPFHDAIMQIGVLILPRISRDEARTYTSIKGSGDKAIAAAAAKFSATICTNDLTDFRHCHNYGLQVTTPQQLTCDGSVGLHTLVPGLVLTSSQGTICAEVSQLHWAGVNFEDTATDKFYIFDAESIGCCYFDAPSNSFVICMDFGPRICIPHGVPANNELPLYIIVSYDSTSEVAVYIGPSSRASSSGEWMPPSLISFPRTWIGCDRHGENQLNGCLRILFGMPYMVNARAAKNIREGVSVNNPWERLSLEDIIKFCVLGG